MIDDINLQTLVEMNPQFEKYHFKGSDVEITAVEVTEENFLSLFFGLRGEAIYDAEGGFYFNARFMRRAQPRPMNDIVGVGKYLVVYGDEVYPVPGQLFETCTEPCKGEMDKFPRDYVTITDMDSTYYMRLGIRLDMHPDVERPLIQILGKRGKLPFSRHAFVDGPAILGDYLKFKEGDAVIIHGYDAPRDLDGRLATIRSVDGNKAMITLQDTKNVAEAKLNWLNMVTETQNIEVDHTGRVSYKFDVDQLVEVVGHRLPPEFRNQIGTVKSTGLGDKEIVQTFSVEFPDGQQEEFYGYQLGVLTDGLSNYERREQYWQSCTGKPSPYAV